MSTTLTINGTAYTAAQRAAAQIWLDSWGWDLDGDSSCIFQETPSAQMAPRFKGGQAVSVAVSGTTRFSGEIMSVKPEFTDNGWVYSYRCGGFKYQADFLYVTAIDGSGTMVYNLPADDIDYIAANSGLSVGQILTAVITQHSTALAALGVTTDATTASQLAALTLVPNVPVYIQGSLIQALQEVLMQFAKNVALQITPDAGVFRFHDTTAGSDLYLTLGTDPIDPPCFSRDVSRCASRVIVRGQGQIYPAYVSLAKSTITPAWTSGQQTAWNYTDFTQPSDAYDAGTIAPGGITSPTTVTVTSSDATRTWATNFWSGREAWMYLHSSVGSGFTYTESRPVTANASMTAGGTSSITLSFDLQNAGSSAYDSYELIGSYAPLGSSGLNNVFRLFDVTDPGGLIANHLTKRFPVPVPFVNQSGTLAQLTSYPEALIVKNLAAWPATFKIMPATGQLLFDEPVVKPLNDMSTLNTGGSGVAVPDDIYVLLAYSRGALTATYPPDVGGVPQYSGTSYSVEGIAYTAYYDVDSWIYAGNQSLMQSYAQMIQQSVCDTVVSGTVTYKGAYAAAYAPNVRLSISGTGFTTGLESLEVPIRSFTQRYHANGQGGLNYSCQLGCSSHRNPATGDRQFVHNTLPSQTGFTFDFGGAGALATSNGVPGMQNVPSMVMPAFNLPSNMGNPDAGPAPSFQTPDASNILATLGITL